MNILRRKLAWSLRRLRIDIPDDALVLEVGSGGNPYPRSNVLLDAYEVTRERHWERLVHDRPTILTFGECLPFKDKVFDYVIAAHVLEHSPYPEQFLAELQRVARAGYIETPDAFMERINPYKDHRLEVTLRDDCLIIRKKSSWIVDEELVELYEDRAKRVVTCQTIPQNPSDFHMCYFWSDKIRFEVINPEVDACWSPPGDDLKGTSAARSGLTSKLRAHLLEAIRHLFSQKTRNASLDIRPFMRCFRCHSENITPISPTEIGCQDCASVIRQESNIYRVV